MLPELARNVASLVRETSFCVVIVLFLCIMGDGRELLRVMGSGLDSIHQAHSAPLLFIRSTGIETLV